MENEKKKRIKMVLSKGNESGSNLGKSTSFTIQMSHQQSLVTPCVGEGLGKRAAWKAT